MKLRIQLSFFKEKKRFGLKPVMQFFLIAVTLFTVGFHAFAQSEDIFIDDGTFLSTSHIQIDTYGEYAVVCGAHSAQTDPVIAVVYKKDEQGAWQRYQEIKASGNYPERLSRPVAMHGNWLLIGSPQDNEAFLYELNTSTSTFELHETFSGTGDFGHAVDIHNNTLVISAPKKENPLFPMGVYIVRNYGAVYRSTYTSAWSPLAEIYNPTTGNTLFASTVDHFGKDISVNDNYISIYGKLVVYYRDPATGSVGASATYALWISSNGQVFDQKMYEPYGNTYNNMNLEMNDRFLIVGAVESGGNGDVYIYDLNKAPGEWAETSAKLTRPNNTSRFGSSVGIQSYEYEGETQHYAVVSDPSESVDYNYAGAAFMYQRGEDGTWGNYKYKFKTGNQQSNEFFGADMSFQGGQLLFTSQKNNKPAMHAFDLTPPAVSSLQVSKNQFTDSIELSWSGYDDSGYDILFRKDGFKIFDNTDSQIFESQDDQNFYDAVEPGVVKSYKMAAYNVFGNSQYVVDVGRSRSNRKIEGKVRALIENGGGGVGGLKLKTDVEGNAVELAGNTQSRLENSNIKNFPADSFTVELRLKTTDTDCGIISYEHASQTNTLIVYAAGGSLRLYLNNIILIETPLAFNDNNWHHVAYTFENTTGTVTCYFDGEKVDEVTGTGIGQTLPSNGYFMLGQEQDAVGGGLNNSQSYSGLLDEIRIWDGRRTSEQIQTYANSILTGKENSLVSYWNFDQDASAPTNYVIDNAAVTGNDDNDLRLLNASIVPVNTALEYVTHTSNEDGVDKGSFTFDNLFYNGTDTFTVIPDTTGNRSYDPDHTQVILDNSTTEETDLLFEDLSILTVKSFITYDNTGCPVKDVAVIVRSSETNQVVDTVYTIADGSYETTLQSGTYSFKPVYHDHVFDQDSVEFDVNETSTGMIDFINITTRTLSGKVVAGSCDYPVGWARILVQFPGSCIDSTVTITTTPDSSGIERYSIELPALQDDYLLTIDTLDNEQWELIEAGELGYFAKTKQTNLVGGDSTVHFYYRTEPEMIITNGAFPGADCDLPVMKQHVDYQMTFRLQEAYEVGENIEVCPVTTPHTLHVYDDIGDAEAQAIHKDSADYTYTIKTGKPNIVGGGKNPYQKKFQIIAEIDHGGTTDYTQWAYVTGSRPREKTFTTTSPELPLLILRDPPGDASSSSISESETTCFASSMSLLTDNSVGTELELNAGVQFELGGLGYSVETEITSSVTTAMEAGISQLNTTEHEYCLTTTTEFSTSDSDLFTGEAGDVYVGAALNIVYAITDVLEIKDCTPVLSKNLIYGLNGQGEGPFETIYAYTQGHIEDFVIPSLRELSVIDPDEERKQRAKDQIEVWEQTLEYNKELKANAGSLPVYSGGSNISFSAGADVSRTMETTVSSTRTTEYNIYLDAEVAYELGVNVGGVGFSFGTQVRSSWEQGESTSEMTSNTRTTSFTLSDDDPGDAFTLDAKIDPVYATPVFDLLSGVTKCPNEEGTVPRESAQLTIDKNLITGIEPDQEAVFNLNLGNTSQSGEAISYDLVFLQESNPEGIELRVGGSEVQGGIPVPYTIDPLSSVNATLTAARGPVAYNYPGLQMVLRSQCDIYQVADTVSFSVNYNTPCSEITLFRPEEGWTVNRANNNELKIILTGYDLDLLNSVTIEYSPRNKNSWNTGIILSEDQLEEDHTILYYSTHDLPEGEFDIRAVVECDGGVFYSDKAGGVIDREAPVLFGNPSPANGRYTTNGNISMRFAEPINCNTVNADNVGLVNKETGEEIAVSAVCDGQEVLIIPADALSDYDGQVLTLIATGIADLNDNVLPSPIEWPFLVSTNPLYVEPRVFTKSVMKENADTSGHVILSNTGNNPLDVTVTGMPAWLSVNESDFTILAGNDKALQLMIHENMLPVGNYKDTLLVTNNEGTLRLPVSVNIISKPPVDAPLVTSADSMSVFAGVYVNSFAFGDVNDMLYAYNQNGDLKGSVKLEKLLPWDEYLAELNIYGTDSDIITFEYWDASKDSIYSIKDTLYFVADTSYGLMNADSGFVHALEIDHIDMQLIALKDGWNWISKYVDDGDASLEEQLSGMIPSHGSVIKGHHSFSQYVMGQGWIGPLKQLETGKGYKINIFRAIELPVFGQPYDSTKFPDFSLAEGWNWIGAPAEQRALEEVFDLPAGDTGYLLHELDSAHFDTSWISSYATINPGDGYTYFNSSSRDVNWYNEATQELYFDNTYSRFIMATEQLLPSGNYPNTMTIVGEISVGGQSVASGEVMVFAFDADDVCIGISEPVYHNNKWLHFLNVYGNASGDSVYLRVIDVAAGNEYEVDAPLTFEVDGISGNPAAPVQWEVATETLKSFNVAPTSISLSNTEIQSDISIGKVFAVISAVDPNAADVLEYSLVAGDGDTDNDLFEINGELLEVGSSLAGISKNTLSIRIRVEDGNGGSYEQSFEITVVHTTGVDEAIAGENRFMVSQNYPNPFSNQTQIMFTMKLPGSVIIELYNATGAKVYHDHLGVQSAGKHYYSISGEQLASGIYHYRVIFNNKQEVIKKMIKK